MNRYLQWIVALSLLLALTIAIVSVLRNAEYIARRGMFGQLAIALFLSPAMFWFVPRAWLASPRAMLLSWWVLPVTVSFVSASYIGDRGETYMFEPFGVLVAGFWAMFAPVIVVGLRRARLERKLRLSAEAGSVRDSVLKSG